MATSAAQPLAMPTDARRAYRVAIGRRINDARARAGLTRAHLATLLDVSPRTIGQWETARHMPAADDLGRLATATRCSLDWLVGRQDSGTVLLINRRTEALLLTARSLDTAFDDRHVMVAVVADDAAEPCDTLQDFAKRLHAIRKHRDQLTRGHQEM